MYVYMCIYIYIYIYVLGANGPPPTKGEGVVMVMLLPSVGCEVDNGGAHRIYRRRVPPMRGCPPPCGCGVEVHMA